MSNTTTLLLLGGANAAMAALNWRCWEGKYGGKKLTIAAFVVNVIAAVACLATIPFAP